MEGASEWNVRVPKDGCKHTASIVDSFTSSINVDLHGSSCTGSSLSYVAGDIDGTLLAFSQWERSPEWRVRHT